MLTISEDVKKRFFYDLSFLTIALSDHYLTCFKPIELMYDALLTDLCIEAVPILFDNLDYNIKLGSTHKIHNVLYKENLSVSEKENNKPYVEDWERFKGMINQPNLTIDELIRIIEIQLLATIILTQNIAKIKTGFFLKATKQFGKPPMPSSASTMAPPPPPGSSQSQSQSKPSSSPSSFDHFRLFYIKFLMKTGNKNIIHIINKLKLLLDITIEYKEADTGKQKIITLKQFMPNILSYLYNLLITSNQVKSFLQSLPSSSETTLNLTKTEILRYLKEYLNQLNGFTEKTDNLMKYAWDRNYLKKLYCQNYINYNWERFKLPTFDTKKFKFVNFENLKSIKVKSIVTLMHDESKKEEKDNNDQKDNSTDDSNRTDGLNTQNDLDMRIYQFPNFTNFLLSSRPLRISNKWYLYILLATLNFKFAAPGSTKSNLIRIDQKIQDIVRLNNVTFTLLQNNTKTNRSIKEGNIMQFYQIIRKVQLPYSYTILMIIVNFELLVGSLFDLNRKILDDMNKEFYGASTEDNGDGKDFQRKDHSGDNDKESEPKGGNGKGDDSNENYDNGILSDLKERVSNDTQTAEEKSIVNNVTKAIKTKVIDDIIETVNLLTDYTSLIIKELNNKKILVEDFLHQLVEAERELVDHDGKKKPSIHKFTRREEKIIKSLFCTKITMYFKVLNKIIHEFMIFGSEEEALCMNYSCFSPVIENELEMLSEFLEKLNKVKFKDNEVLTRKHLTNLRYKTISIKLAKIMYLVQNIKTVIEENPNVLKQKHDEVFEKLISEIIEAFCEIRSLVK